MLGLTTAITGDIPYQIPFNEYSLQLDGTDDCVVATVAQDTYRSGNGFSVSFMVKLDDGNPSSELSFFGFNDRNDDNHFKINLTRFGEIKIYHKANGDSATAITDEPEFTDGIMNNWFRYTITVIPDSEADTQYNVYRNNLERPLTVSDGVSNNNHVLFEPGVATAIGARNNATTGQLVDHIKGLIDEVAVWDVALDQTQINGLYSDPFVFDFNNSNSTYNRGADLQNFYRFEEGSGTTVEDLSPNSNNGTIQGGAVFVSDVSHRGAGYA